MNIHSASGDTRTQRTRFVVTSSLLAGFALATMCAQADAQQLKVKRVPYKLSCVAVGPEFTDDLMIGNNSYGIVPAGTKIRWRVDYGQGYPSSRGLYTLPKLGPHKSVVISNALRVGVAAGTPCTVTVLRRFPVLWPK